MPKRKKSSPDKLAILNPEMPEHLKKSIAEARTHTVPSIDDLTKKVCPHLFEYLSPRELKIEGDTEDARPKETFAEPLLMISWDRRAGTYKWSLMNKTINYGCGGSIIVLGNTIQEIEDCIAENRHCPRELKPIK